MSSHDIRIIVEHYENGGFGVIGSNYQVMGISDSEDIGKHTKNVMLKELNKLILDKLRKRRAK
jgi:hypothetical protein